MQPEPEPVLPFFGLTHDEALAAELPQERYLIDDLIPVGTVGTIAGVPETCKSWLAQAIAIRCARGEGEILGQQVARQVDVGYWWQDDSTREELERIRVFETAHSNPPGLPIRWYLNEGLRLPDGVDRLKATIEQHKLGLVVLDSFYNVAADLDLKDAGAELVVAQLKRDIADATGCTVLIVDHMPWANETNRQRLRSYGGVFKNAATRFGIYIDAAGTNLQIEARGNNIRGFKKRAAWWDEDRLELRLAEHSDHDETVEQRADAILTWLTDNPGSHSTTAVCSAVKGRDEVTREALEALKARDAVYDHGRDGGTWSGKTGSARLWIASIHAAAHGIQTASQLPGTWSDEVGARSLGAEPRPESSIEDVVSRDAVTNGHLDPDDIERLADLAREYTP